MRDTSKATTKSHLMSFAHPSVLKQDIGIYTRVRTVFDSITADTRIKGSAFNAMYVVNGKIKAAAEAQVSDEVTLLVTDELLKEWLTADAAKAKTADQKMDDAVKAVIRAGKADPKYVIGAQAAVDILKQVQAGKKLPAALVDMIEKMKG